AADRAELLARMHRGERVARTTLTVSEVAQLARTGEWPAGALGCVHARALRAHRPTAHRRLGRCAHPAYRKLRATVKRSGITATGRLSLHSLRHGFASLVIAKGLNVVFVSRQLGHANPTVTLSTYAHLFERADHAQAASEALEASYAATARTAAP